MLWCSSNDAWAASMMRRFRVYLGDCSPSVTNWNVFKVHWLSSLAQLVCLCECDLCCVCVKYICICFARMTKVALLTMHARGTLGEVVITRPAPLIMNALCHSYSDSIVIWILVIVFPICCFIITSPLFVQNIWQHSSLLFSSRSPMSGQLRTAGELGWCIIMPIWFSMSFSTLWK